MSRPRLRFLVRLDRTIGVRESDSGRYAFARPGIYSLLLAPGVAVFGASTTPVPGAPPVLSQEGKARAGNSYSLEMAGTISPFLQNLFSRCKKSVNISISNGRLLACPLGRGLCLGGITQYGELGARARSRGVRCQRLNSGLGVQGQRCNRQTELLARRAAICCSGL